MLTSSRIFRRRRRFGWRTRTIAAADSAAATAALTGVHPLRRRRLAMWNLIRKNGIAIKSIQKKIAISFNRN